MPNITIQKQPYTTSNIDVDIEKNTTVLDLTERIQNVEDQIEKHSDLLEKTNDSFESLVDDTIQLSDKYTKDLWYIKETFNKLECRLDKESIERENQCMTSCNKAIKYVLNFFKIYIIATVGLIALVICLFFIHCKQFDKAIWVVCVYIAFVISHCLLFIGLNNDILSYIRKDKEEDL